MNTLVADNFKQWFEEQSKKENSSELSVILNYFGAYSEDLIYRISETIEEELIKKQFSYTFVKKIFASVTEAINNIIKHGRKAEASLGGLTVYTEGHVIKVQISNIISSSKSASISASIDELNKLKKAEMDARFFDLMKRSIVSNTSSLGIGFLSIRMNSSSDLKYTFTPITDTHSVFSLQFEVEANAE